MFRRSILDMAALGDIAGIRDKINRGKDLNKVDEKNGWTALMYASVHGHTDIAMALVDNGANMNVKDTLSGNTALAWAVKEENFEIARYLVDKGADANVHNNDGYSALDYARDKNMEAELIVEKRLLDAQEANQLEHQKKAASLKASLKAEKEAEDARIAEEHTVSAMSSPDAQQKTAITLENADVDSNVANINVLSKIAHAVEKFEIMKQSPGKNSKISRISMEFSVPTSALDGVFADAGNKEKFAEILLGTICNGGDSANLGTEDELVDDDTADCASTVQEPSSVETNANTPLTIAQQGEEGDVL